MRAAVLLLVLPALLAAGCARRPGEAQVSVFFTRSEGNAIVLAEVSRTVPGGDPRTVLTAALAELLRGPTEEEQAGGLVTQIPPGTRLRGVRIEGGVAHVDLSGEFESGGGSASMLGRMWQVVYTATQLRAASHAQILIDGQHREAMGGEGVIIASPLGRPPTPPRF
jgi:spore germination protein GerM